MATKENDLPEGNMTICGRCKEKFTAFWKDVAEEWSNNFKMCYCPWESKTYDVDSDQITSDQSQLQWQKEQEMANVAQGDTEIQVRKLKTGCLLLVLQEVHCQMFPIYGFPDCPNKHLLI